MSWALFFDGSVCRKELTQAWWSSCPKIRVCFCCRAKNQQSSGISSCRKRITITGLLWDVVADTVEIIRDSLLIFSLLIDKYECKDKVLRAYHEDCQELMWGFRNISFRQMPMEPNEEANRKCGSKEGEESCLGSARAQYHVWGSRAAVRSEEREVVTWQVGSRLGK
jgi:hypothetical protein